MHFYSHGFRYIYSNSLWVTIHHLEIEMEVYNNRHLRSFPMGTTMRAHRIPHDDRRLWVKWNVGHAERSDTTLLTVVPVVQSLHSRLRRWKWTFYSNWLNKYSNILKWNGGPRRETSSSLCGDPYISSQGGRSSQSPVIIINQEYSVCFGRSPTGQSPRIGTDSYQGIINGRSDARRT